MSCTESTSIDSSLRHCDIYWSSVRDGFKSLEMNIDQVFAVPNIHTSFISASKGHDKHYVEITDIQELKDVLEAKLLSTMRT